MIHQRYKTVFGRGKENSRLTRSLTAVGLGLTFAVGACGTPSPSAPNLEKPPFRSARAFTFTLKNGLPTDMMTDLTKKLTAIATGTDIATGRRGCRISAIQSNFQILTPGSIPNSFEVDTENKCEPKDPNALNTASIPTITRRGDKITVIGNIAIIDETKNGEGLAAVEGAFGTARNLHGVSLNTDPKNSLQWVNGGSIAIYPEPLDPKKLQ